MHVHGGADIAFEFNGNFYHIFFGSNGILWGRIMRILIIRNSENSSLAVKIYFRWVVCGGFLPLYLGWTFNIFFFWLLDFINNTIISGDLFHN